MSYSNPCTSCGHNENLHSTHNKKCSSLYNGVACQCPQYGSPTPHSLKHHINEYIALMRQYKIRRLSVDGTPSIEIELDPYAFEVNTPPTLVAAPKFTPHPTVYNQPWTDGKADTSKVETWLCTCGHPLYSHLNGGSPGAGSTCKAAEISFVTNTINSCPCPRFTAP